MAGDVACCPKCGAKLPGDAPQGLCPVCLLRQGLDTGAPTHGEPGATGAAIEGTGPDAENTPIAGSTASFTPRHPGSSPDPRATSLGPTWGGNDEGNTPCEPGTLVRSFGDYELIRELGRGGMGVVYQARQLSLNRPVALKMLKADTLATDDELRRFRIEAEAVALLDHPHIVPILEIGEHDGRSYFTMKLIGGPSLDKRLADYAADPAAAARLVATVAEAVYHAHLRGILHRDLKPANVLIDDRGEPHVSDFGLAKRIDEDSELTISGAILGTPAYMAPEQASGQRGAVTTASDVYGLGAVLYALLAGRAPFQGDSVMETLRQVRERPPEPPSRANPRTPSDLEVICLKCLEKDPRRRYASAEALAEDLRRYQAGEPIWARRAGAWERAVKWARRRPAIAGLVVLVVLTAGLGLGGILWQWRDAVWERQRADRQVRLTRQALEQAERDLTRAETALYAGAVAQAQRSYEEGDPFRAGEILDETRGKYRGWEYRYLRALCRNRARLLTVPTTENVAEATRALPPDHRDWARSSATGAVLCVAYSPDGRHLAAGGGSMGFPGVLRIFDTVTWEVTQTFRADHAASDPPRGDDDGQRPPAPGGHSNWVTALAYSPDGRRLASASADGKVKVWDARTGRLVLTLEGHTSELLALAYSPDGELIASASTSTRLPTGPLEPAKFRPGEVKVWHADSGRELRNIDDFEREARSLAFSPDGRRLALAVGDGRVYDVDSGRRTLTLQSDNPGMSQALAVVFSADGLRLATADFDGRVRVWDADTGQGVLSIQDERAVALTGVAFSPDGRRLAVTSTNDRAVKALDSRTGRTLLKLQGPAGRPNGGSFSPDNRHLATAHPEGVVVWETSEDADYRALEGHTDLVTSVAFRPDGRTLASGSVDNTVSVWSPVTGRRTLRLTAWDDPPTTAGVHHVAFSPDGTRLAAADFDRAVRVWDLATGERLLTLRGHGLPVYGVAFSPDGVHLASAGANIVRPGQAGEGKIWDLATGREHLALRGITSGITRLAYTSDGAGLASSTLDGRVCLWEARTGRVTRTDDGPFAASSLALRRDGRLLVIASTDTNESRGPGEVKAWEVADGRKIFSLRGDLRGTHRFAVSPDGRRLIAGGGDYQLGVLKLWDTETGLEVFSLRGLPSEVTDLAISPDGSRLALGCGSRILLYDSVAESE